MTAAEPAGDPVPARAGEASEGPAAEPAWAPPLRDLAGRLTPRDLSRFVPPPGHERRSAVLVLFGDGPRGPELMLTERAAALRQHAGQVSFPGGRLEPGEDAVAAALRETHEEAGVDPALVHVLAPWPTIHLPVTDHAVTPVLAWWRPAPLPDPDPGEVARVVSVDVAELVDPARRFTVRHPSGFTGPGFAVQGLFVWGFTAGLLDRVLALAGWDRPWTPARTVSLVERDGVLSPDDLSADGLQ